MTNDELHAEGKGLLPLSELSREMLDDQCATVVGVLVRLTGLLSEVERLEWYRDEGNASIVGALTRRGLPVALARTLESTVRARLHDGRVPVELERGRMHLDAAAVLGEVARGSNALRSALPWFELSTATDPRTFFRTFVRCRAELTMGKRVTQYSALVDHDTQEILKRCQDLMARKFRGPVLRGEMLNTLGTSWLVDNDPLREAEGTRRMPDTATTPWSREVPAEVARHAMRRNDDHCPVPGCVSRIYMHSCHVTPYKHGGCQEKCNILRMCAYHNTLHEEGYLVISGTAEDPVFTDRYGRPVEYWGLFLEPPPGMAEVPVGTDRPKDPDLLREAELRATGWTSERRRPPAQGHAGPPPPGFDVRPASALEGLRRGASPPWNGSEG